MVNREPWAAEGRALGAYTRRHGDGDRGERARAGSGEHIAYMIIGKSNFCVQFAYKSRKILVTRWYEVFNFVPENMTNSAFSRTFFNY